MRSERVPGRKGVLDPLFPYQFFVVLLERTLSSNGGTGVSDFHFSLPYLALLLTRSTTSYRSFETFTASSRAPARPLSPHSGHPATKLVFRCIQRSLIPCQYIHGPFSIIAYDTYVILLLRTLHELLYCTPFRSWWCVYVHYQITGFNEHKDMRVCELGPRMCVHLWVYHHTLPSTNDVPCLIDRWLHFRGVSLHRFLPSYTTALG
ncbi:hypothetical protein B0H65DRAFT_333388 [Neurospora tetraspora]|uniref:Uncharacterized protein n=1 Tax=Neurospora tetraspora TaxID=94610 RepID=A0AAE0MJU4_9PEZI|nr:hypothetical protein B0H65DRAFT_333388 [Neurospora tetraspora]